MIIKFQGTGTEAALALANALRNSQISNGKGALLIQDASIGEPKILLEKIIAGAELPVPAPEGWETTIPWKANPTILLVGEAAEEMLDTFEEMLPGFVEHFGPVTVMTSELE